MHAFQLVLFNDLLEYIGNFLHSFLSKRNTTHVAVGLFSNSSQKMSKRRKNISNTLSYTVCATSQFLPHFDSICDLLLSRRTAT